MATAQNIIGELESLLEGLSFTVVEAEQDHNYGPMKASIDLPTTEYTLANLGGDYKVDGTAAVVMVLADRKKGILRRVLTPNEFTAQDSVIVLGKPASADYLRLQSALQDFTDQGRRRITMTLEVGWTQER